MKAQLSWREKLLMFDRRREPRMKSNLTVLIWGIDIEGMRFSQSALARNISQHGALLAGIEWQLRPGDLLGIQHGQKRARFRVVWARSSGTEEKTLAAVHKLEAEACPWLEKLHPPTEATTLSAADLMADTLRSNLLSPLLESVQQGEQGHG